LVAFCGGLVGWSIGGEQQRASVMARTELAGRAVMPMLEFESLGCAHGGTIALVGERRRDRSSARTPPSRHLLIAHLIY